ncbi:MAG: hypothetical protein PWQ82_548 [Thermosediminibacterales bacterium]|nr:hypothetical protein [Thermosediminibacterales bacterium]MDK2835961.1 hypothetical protein [Thermosediminibacterales bacterium]
MNYKEIKKFKKDLAKLVVFLEAGLSLFIILGLIIATYDLVKYLDIIYNATPEEAYSVFHSFLGQVLLLVIGLELILMLVKHSPLSVVEVLLFAIARKLLVETKTMWEILLGVIALGVLFLIIRNVCLTEFEPDDSEP